ncbi:MAG: hypothetical protein K8F25_16485 [Fimbriimonadaceae bacterium]|nr:hypothetical protein [Alphaproteobacteria bacterium]
MDEKTRTLLGKEARDRLVSQDDNIPWRTISVALAELEKARGNTEDVNFDEIENFLKTKF